MNSDTAGDKDSKVSTEEVKSKLKKLTEEEKANDMLVAFHSEQEKYASKTKKLLKKGSARENQTMDILNKFKSKLFTVKQTDSMAKINEDSDESDDDGGNWMANTLR